MYALSYIILRCEGGAGQIATAKERRVHAALVTLTHRRNERGCSLRMRFKAQLPQLLEGICRIIAM